MEAPGERGAPREPLDDARTLTRLVGRFRRLARLAAADPLRGLPADPVTALAVLGAPVTALITFAPLERLRQALAPPAHAAAAGVGRGRLRPLGDRAAAARSGGSPAPAGRPARPVSPPDALATARRPVQARTSEAQTGPARGRRDAPSIAILGQRRAAARRAAAATGTPPSRALEAPPPTAAAPGASRATRPFPEAEVARREPDATAPVAPTTWPALLRQLLEAAHHDPPRAWNVLPPAASGGELDPADGAPASRVDVAPSSAAGLERGALDGSPRSAAGALVTPSPPRPVSAPVAGDPAAVRAGSRRGGDAARSPRSSGDGAGLGPADELFESLYREGVDLTWP
jgi:hypothetical protein